MTKHLVIPAKRLWRRHWLCIHCGATGKQDALFDREGCPGPAGVQHDKSRCDPNALPCTCPCGFCRSFPGGDR